MKWGFASFGSYQAAHFLLDVETQLIYKQISRVPMWSEAKTNKQKRFTVFCFAEQIDMKGVGGLVFISVLDLVTPWSPKK